MAQADFGPSVAKEDHSDSDEYDIAAAASWLRVGCLGPPALSFHPFVGEGSLLE